MTILQSLVSLADRFTESTRDDDQPFDAYGFTTENIGFALSFDADGEIVDISDLRTEIKKNKFRARRLSVPRPKRTSNIQPNFLWDKTAYAFGVDGGKSKRLDREHASFVEFHREALSPLALPEARAFLKFLDRWTPERFRSAPFSKEMTDENFIFSLDGTGRYLHDCPELRALWLTLLEDPSTPTGWCMVTHQFGPLESSHPVIKGVDDAQTAGAYLVSVNASAFTSYGVGENALGSPVSKLAASRYGAALNRLLDRATSRNRIRIGDATVVFWAEADQVGEAAAEAAEELFAEVLDPEAAARRRGETDAEGAAKIAAALAQVQKGRPVSELGLGLAEGTRFHILGLAPNAARLSVRFWLSDDVSEFARRLARHAAVTALEPRPFHWVALPALRQLLVKTTAAQEKFENIPPALAGELTRAILSGGRYPRTLLSAALMRIRAGDDPATGWHAAAIRAVLLTNPAPGHPEPEKETPVSLDRDNPSPAYQLGRLFAVMETAQYFALGKVNATIRDRYFGAASATPASVFPLLLRNVQSHLGKLRKEHKGGWLEYEITDIMDRLGPELPRSLPLEAQGRFVLGYYHQRRGAAAERPEAAEALTDMTSDTRTEDTSDDD